MFNKKLVRKAHKETKKMKKEFPMIAYSFQFGLEMKYLLSEIKEVENIMVELKGSKEQITWAEDIRKEKMKDWEKEQDYMKENATNQKYVDELTAAIERIFSVEHASNWIDMRNHSIISLAKADMKKKLMLYCHDIDTEKAFADRY